jgi:ribosomal protein S18 acetylase RimI-like enzyme
MNTFDVCIRLASSPADIAAVVACFKAYTEWLQLDLTFQNYAAELASLPGKYSPPTGALLLAKDASTDQVLGCVAMRPIELSSEYKTTQRRNERRYCEMKRLYVYPEARGRNVARLLIREVMERARQEKYDEVLLDTLETMPAALKLYRSEGFVPMEPYYDNQLTGVFFFAKKTEGN